MFSFSSEDVLGTLKKSPNINSAIKNFLKRQVRPGDTSGRFAKDLRDALLARGDDRALLFIDKHSEAYAPHLLAIGAYAHAELVDKIAAAIVTKYADDFNKTYESDGETVKVKNETKFQQIMKSALDDVSKALSEAGHSESQFLRAIVLNAVFEQPVLQEGVDQGLL